MKDFATLGADRHFLAFEERDELTSLLIRMNVPRSKHFDLKWLRRHIAPDYLDHPNMPEAFALVKQRCEEMGI